MATYHLYFLRNKLLIGSEDIEAATDAEAAQIAREKGNGDVVEVWNAHSLIDIVSSTPATAEQPPPLALA